MGHFLTDEDFPFNVAVRLRTIGHDVLTVYESGLANRSTPDAQVLEFAISQGRIVLSMNRRHFIRLHRERPGHRGIVICTADPDADALAARIDQAVTQEGSIAGRLLRVNRPGS